MQTFFILFAFPTLSCCLHRKDIVLLVEDISEKFLCIRRFTPTLTSADNEATWKVIANKIHASTTLVARVLDHVTLLQIKWK